MGYFPIFGGGGTTSDAGADTATTLGVLMVNGGVANTKGNWTQLLASTPRHCTGIIVFIGQGTVANTDALIDIGIGAAASEVAVISNLHQATNASGTSGILGSTHYYIPVSIPAGVRLSARMQSASTTHVCKVNISLIMGGLHTKCWSFCEAVGVATGTSLLTAMSHPASNNTKGSYVQLVASSTRRYTGLLLKTGKGQANATQFWLMDVAIGGGGSEKIIIPNLSWSQNTTTDNMECANDGPYQVDIPAATRISARIQIDVTGAGRDMWFGVYGLS